MSGIPEIVTAAMEALAREEQARARAIEGASKRIALTAFNPETGELLDDVAEDLEPEGEPE